MKTNLGFGEVKPQPKSQRSAERAKAGQQLESLRADGVPEFEVYIRIKDKKPWFPVGAIAVKRSSQINQAIFANQEELLQGAFRLFPVLRKNQTQLEYGYRCKEFKDEPIQLAVQPQAGVVGTAKSIQSVVGQLGDRIATLFKR
ncbi:MAG TPA: HHL1-like protein [Thermosynechococcaceae cyanobacterium]